MKYHNRHVYHVKRHVRQRLSANTLPDIDTNSSYALAISPATPPVSMRQHVIESVQAVARTLLFFLIFTTMLGRFEIRQTSMEPNFHEGQRVMVSQVGSFWLEHFAPGVQAANGNQANILGLQRGQVVVFFELPDHQGDALIKRLIGLPGDTIDIRDGRTFINGLPLNEPYLTDQYTSCITYCGPLVLGSDEYFFMGDNRGVSRDSRSFGPVSTDQIIGQVILRFWPLDQFGLFL